jgi:FMN phosphatase YigB (HAD superfamily)
MKYTTILFDADGTLYDFDKAAVEALKSSFNKYNLDWTENTFSIYEAVFWIMGIPIPLTELFWAFSTTLYFSIIYKFAVGSGYREQLNSR